MTSPDDYMATLYEGPRIARKLCFRSLSNFQRKIAVNLKKQGKENRKPQSQHYKSSLYKANKETERFVQAGNVDVCENDHHFWCYLRAAMTQWNKNLSNFFSEHNIEKRTS